MEYNARNMYKSCLRKKKYYSEKFAKEMAKKMSKKFNKEYYHYYCPLCNGWHLATRKEKK